MYTWYLNMSAIKVLNATIYLDPEFDLICDKFKVDVLLVEIQWLEHAWGHEN